LPKPSLYNSLGLPFIELRSVESTNNYALTQLHAGLTRHGAAFFAYDQTAGKGQRGKTWQAAKGSGIIISVVINPHPLQLSQQFHLSACIALSVCEFFDQYAGGSTKIKWPNDLYWNDRKAGGILIENIIGQRKPEIRSQKYGARTQEYVDNRTLEMGNPQWASDPTSSRWLWAVAGIGININQTVFPDELANAVSLKQITGNNYDPVKLAKELCLLLDKNFKKLLSAGFEDIYTSYLSQLYKKNEPVKLKKDNRVFEALIKSVSPGGELIVQHAIEERFQFGEIEWIIKQGKSIK
jgi:BirA family transcriptional regulator, biotin operon repressor / biotin---[acetyl-CoA-carboxylase] ligase